MSRPRYGPWVMVNARCGKKDIRPVRAHEVLPGIALHGVIYGISVSTDLFGLTHIGTGYGFGAKAFSADKQLLADLAREHLGAVSWDFKRPPQVKTKARRAAAHALFEALDKA